ncbi:MAG: Gfo/Idh/MocA family protein [Planctomycetota bacterium]
MNHRRNDAGGSGRRSGRRRFLAAGLGLPWVVPRHVLGGAAHQAPSDTLRIAAVGVGGMGKNYLRGCEGERIVALCDVDHRFSRPVFEKYPKAARYRDHREMFDKEAQSFDALIVATPDHTHTVVLMPALELEKHVYCAKPITHSVGEARRVRKAVLAAPELVTKSSVQSSATDAARSTTELLSCGAIGRVRRLHVWCDHPRYPCLVPRPQEAQTPPPGMDWNLWIGPAPYRPYHSAYHPGNWRSWWDFGSGAVGDMTCHTLHVYFQELKLGAPTTVYSRSSHGFKGYFRDPVLAPECQSHANMVTWEFPSRGELPPLAVHWYDGGMKPHRPDELDDRLELPRMGLLFEGEEGKLLAGFSGGNPFDGKRGLPGGLLLPEAGFRDFPQPPKTLRRCERGSHYREWCEACKTGAKTVCPIELGCEMTEMGLLGALSLRAKERLLWDAEAMRVTNSDAANEYVDPPYRNGWTI